MSHQIKAAHATALYVGALLGPGVLTLPALAAAVAGPGSLLAWSALVAASIPLAATFTSLAIRHPSDGGLSAIAARAFGPRAYTIIGWWFVAATPMAAYVAAMLGGQYAATALGMGRPVALAIAACILGTVFAGNAAGLRGSGRLQLIVVGSLVALLCATVLSATPHVRAANFQPMLPAGPVSIAHAAVVLFIAFSGWEACAHLTSGVANPDRTLPKVAFAAVAIVGLLYLGLATTTIGVLGSDAPRTGAPLITLLHTGMGSAAAPIAGLVALMLTTGAANTFVAGATRLGIALAERGDLPRALISAEGGDRRSLVLQATLTATVAAACTLGHITPGSILRVLSVLLAGVTLAGTSAGIVLLPAGWRCAAAITATIVAATVLGAAGPLLAVPGGLAALAVALPQRLRKVQPGPKPKAQATAVAPPQWRRHPPHRSRRRQPRRRPTAHRRAQRSRQYVARRATSGDPLRHGHQTESSAFRPASRSALPRRTDPRYPSLQHNLSSDKEPTMHTAHHHTARTSTPLRRRLLGPLVAVALLVAAVLTLMPDAAQAHETACQRRDDWVALSPGDSARYRVVGWLCRPSRPTATAQVLLSGFTYDHSYFDNVSDHASYVRAALNAGTAVYNVDRLGVGLSDRPPADQVTAETEAYVTHQLVQRLRGRPDGYRHVVGVGHSYGSAVWMVEAASHHDVDGLILTGYLHQPNAAQQATIAAGLHPAAEDPAFARIGLPDGYVTTKPGTRAADFYYLPGTDQAAIARDERTKSTGTSGERATMGLARDPSYSQHITVPVLLIVGDHDSLSCDDRDLPCRTAAQICARERAFYPPENSLAAAVIPDAGHSIHGHRTALIELALANAWVRTVTSGRSAHWPGCRD